MLPISAILSWLPTDSSMEVFSLSDNRWTFSVKSATARASPLQEVHGAVPGGDIAGGGTVGKVPGGGNMAPSGGGKKPPTGDLMLLEDMGPYCTLAGN